MALIGSLLLVVSGTPAFTATAYQVSQITLAPFTASKTELSVQQRAQIKAAVGENPLAEKFICTGIRFESAPISETLIARKRAKAACDYAKQLSPSLSTYFQSKTTKSRGYAGKVLLTIKTPTSTSTPTPTPTSTSTPTPTPTSTPTPKPTSTGMVYENPSVGTDPVEQCKIRDVSSTRGMTGAGFPEWESMTPKKGVVKWALIPIDFQDLKGERDFRVRVDDQMKKLSDWYKTVSGGKLKIEWVVLDTWATLPGNQNEYAIGQSSNVNDSQNGPKLFNHAMTAADPLFDFSGVSTVNFLLPTGQTFLRETSQGFPWDQVVREFETKEGRIASYSIPGQFFDAPGREYWSYWAHEFGHAIGLPHVGSSRGPLPPFNPWDLMGGQDGASRELSGWLRFFAGWLDADQVYCKEVAQVEEVDLTLVPLSEDKRGIKVAVFPLSTTKAIIIESRRETWFSCPTSLGRNGVLVYVYDARLGHGENFLIPQSTPGREKQTAAPCQVEPNPDFLLRTGDKIVVEGVTVEVINHGNLDKISINRG